MLRLLRHLLGWLLGFFRSRQDLILENLALREQLLALKAKRPRRQLSTMHKFFWIALFRLWSKWKQSLVVVTPRTVVVSLAKTANESFNPAVREEVSGYAHKD